MDELKRIYLDIKNVKIQGASNVAKAGIRAYFIKPTKENKKKLLFLRPTEPALSNALNLAGEFSEKKILEHFEKAQEKINYLVYKLIKPRNVIYTHCHSTNVVKALIYSKKKGKNFSVVNTETRPLYQGRKTAKELSKAGIKVMTYTDSAMHNAITKSDLVLLGADAILKNKAINKIGSGAISELAHLHKKPLYIVSDSWKFSPKNIKIEERDFHEVWKNAPKKIRIMNPAFESIDKKYIRGVVSEYGILSFERFVKKAAKRS